MITIIRKEILDNVQSLQFLMLLVLTLFLFLANGLLFARKYERQIAWYGRRTAEVIDKPSTISTRLHLHPSPFAFIAGGGDEAAPPGYELYQTGGMRPLPAGTGNIRFPAVPEPDWSFIIKVIFSLYAVLLGYDAIAGEKERGTLRLILTGPLGRARVLIAKYAAMMLTLALPLMCGILLSMAAVGLLLPEIATVSAFSAVGQTFILGMVYLSLWAFLCLLVSSVVHDSSLALLALLVAWIVLAIIVPNTAGIVSEKVTSIPSEFSAAKELGPAIQKQVWDKINGIAKSVERGEITTEEELKRRTDLAFAEGQKSLIGFFASYEKAIRGRAETARWISRVSPTALFQFAAEDIAGSGIHREERFLREAHAYSETYDRYVFQKTGKLVAASGWGFGTFIELGGKDIFIGSPHPAEYQGDKSDFPRFVESRRAAGEGLRNALLDCAGLLLWNIVLAGAALGAISRSDVR
jgi:ABC-type transport system involved in multi-copper enzyme maturation permease subunit